MLTQYNNNINGIKATIYMQINKYQYYLPIGRGNWQIIYIMYYNSD